MGLLLMVGGVLVGYLSLLEGPDTDERRNVVDQLTGRGAEVVEPLSAALDQVGWRGREEILKILSRIGPASLPALMRTARFHTSVHARRVAFREAGKVGGSAARDSLLGALESAERDIVIEALGEAGDSTVVPVLRRFLTDPSIDVRRRAVIAVGRVGGAGAVSPLIDALSDEHFSVRFAAAGRLEEIGDAAAAALADRMDESSCTTTQGLSSSAHYLAIRVLGRLKHEAGRPILERALSAEDWSLRAAAANALGSLGSSFSIGRLEAALERETHPFVRAQIRDALDRRGNSE